MADAHLSAADVAPYLLPFLTTQRWFRSTDHRATNPHFTALAQLSPTLHLAQVEAQVGLKSVLYQLPVIICPNGSVPPQAVIMPQPAGHVLADALYHPEGRQLLGQALSNPGHWETTAGSWNAAPLPNAQPCDTTQSRVQTGEQSNSCVVYNDRAILKLYRRLEPGTNPDPEMVGFLSRRGFAHVPPLQAVMRFVDTSGVAHDAAMLQGFVPQAVDGWTHFLQQLSVWLTNPSGPTAALDDAQRLGSITRAMHDALAAPEVPEFAPRPAQSADLLQWVQDVADGANLAWHQLADQQTLLPSSTRNAITRLLTLRPNVDRVLNGVRSSLSGGAGHKLRHHGDYHLGQTLRTHDGNFMILDFEGEPLRPLAARRDPHSPLRDVAGMLRSFAYAAATGAQKHPGTTAAAAAWEAHVSDAFLATYLQAPAPSYLPAPDGVRQLLKLFVLEKALYEVRYEMSHRPTWVPIPLQALERLLGGA